MSIEAGNILRETREQKAVSIKDASDVLHIRIPYLQALENGRAEIIPSSVQARGFLRIYAEYLGLSAADIISEWDNPGSTALSAKTESAGQTASPEVIAAHDPDNSKAAEKHKPRIPFFPQKKAPAPSAPQQQQSPVQRPPAVPTYTQYNQNPVQYQNQSGSYSYSAPVQFQTPPSVQANNPNPSVNIQNSVPTDENSALPIQPNENREKDKGNGETQGEKKGSKIRLFGKNKSETQESDTPKDTPQDLFNAIGHELSLRRNFLALSLEDCETQTLIRSIYLESMEQGNFEQLPSLIQGRGMLNNYASFLDLDVDAIMLKFATALQLLSDKKNKRDEDKKHKPAKRAGILKKFFTPDLFVGVFVIVGIAGIIIYSAITITAYRRNVSIPTPDLGVSLLEQILDTTRTPEFLPTFTPTIQVDMITRAQNQPEEITESESVEVLSSQPVQIFINANQRALMRVAADGKEVFSGRTLPNNTYPFDAENEIELSISNADAISVTYNQQNLGRLGKLGENMTVIFTQYMAATPTPQFSPTPTNTYEPTYTPQPETPLPTNTPTPYIP